ncbi:hypothetical protein Q7P37_008629 [Cladosporium fusiforme]
MGFVSTAVLVLATLWLWKLLNNRRQLSRVPGPLLAGLSDFWRAWYSRNGKLRTKLDELHRQHGTVVRYGVRSISVSDPQVVDMAFGSRAGFVIADSYKVIVGISNGKEVPSLVTIRDEDRHTALRRSVASAFTPNAVLEYESHIDQTIQELLDVLKRKECVDLSSQMAYYTMDAAGRFSFSQSLGCLAADADAGGRIGLIRVRSSHWVRWGSLPDLERLVYRNPLAMRAKRAPSSMVTVAMGLLKERLAKPKSQSEPPDLMTRFLDASQKHPETLDQAAVVGLLMSMISGAGDTTASAVTAIFYYMLKHPSTLAKLHEEFSSSNLNEPIPAFNQVNKLPYLHAVTREGMRLFPVLATPIERKVPQGGVTIAGTFLPEGTSVGCSQSALHHNPDVFGSDADLFRPERWLEADASRLKAMEFAHMGFSRGRRVCIGQNLAVMQMKKLLAALIMGFDISLVDPTTELKANCSGMLVYPEALHVNIKVKP